MNKNDYRNTTYCKELENMICKKEELERKIKIKHPRVTNFYKYVKKEYKKDYLKIYNFKCAYCGISLKVIDFNLFEIDHYKNKASFSKDKGIDKLDNLIISCQNCNRAKGSLVINDSYLKKLNPDEKEIKNYFFRNEKYEIKIKKEYEEDEEIKKFYKSLKFEYEFRKIDFLLLNLEGLYETLGKERIKERIGNIIKLLKDKRSLIDKL